MGFWNVIDAFVALLFAVALSGVIGFAIRARMYFVREGLESLTIPNKGVTAVWNMMFCAFALIIPALYAAFRGSDLALAAWGFFVLSIMAWFAMVLYGDKLPSSGTKS
jgi:hypothetical protein